MLKTLLTCALALATLTACAESDTDNEVAPDAAPNGSAATPSQTPQPTHPAAVSGDDDPDLARPDVQPLTYNEYTQRIPAGSGCSFTDSRGRLLFVATADFEAEATAQGAMKLADRVFVLSANRAGGYTALSQGQFFADPKGTPYEKSSGVAANIVRLPGEGTPGEIETTSWPAEMTVSMEGEGMSKFTGRWECGS